MHSQNENSQTQTVQLRRTLTLPLLIFYGVGVTIGAGIFALIGEILALAGDHAPQVFLFAALIALMTGISYALLVRVFPRAGGEAVFVNFGLGKWAGIAVGYGVLLTAVISSAVITLAFTGYLRSLISAPAPVLIIGGILLFASIAAWGVRESVYVAAAITLLEVGTLTAVVFFGAPLLADSTLIVRSLSPPSSLAMIAPLMSGVVVAFFAFIGFEDIVNMAEETVSPEYTAPRAILWTWGITVLIYMLLSLIAVATPDRAAITSSEAPMATLFEQITGRSGSAVAVIAAIAMINGVLVQIVMAARVLYGMAKEGLAPSWFGKLSQKRRTPVRATALIALVIIASALFFPLVRLAETTSIITLAVFALVNLSLFTMGAKTTDKLIKRFRWFGLAGAALCLTIIAYQLFYRLFIGY